MPPYFSGIFSTPTIQINFNNLKQADPKLLYILLQQFDPSLYSITNNPSTLKLRKKGTYEIIFDGKNETIQLSHSILLISGRFYILEAGQIQKGIFGRVKKSNHYIEILKEEETIKIIKTKQALKIQEFSELVNFKVANEEQNIFKILYPEAKALEEREHAGKKKNKTKFYSLMPLLPGCDVFDLIDKEGKNLSLAQRQLIAFRVIEEVERFYNAGYIHRDIKPENFIYDPLNDTAYIIDFGLAGKKESFVNQCFYCGSTGYLPPEVLAAEKTQNPVNYDEKTEIYSLGITVENILRSYDAQLPLDAKTEKFLKRMKNEHPQKRPSLKEVHAFFYDMAKPEKTARQNLESLDNVLDKALGQIGIQLKKTSQNSPERPVLEQIQQNLEEQKKQVKNTLEQTAISYLDYNKHYSTVKNIIENKESIKALAESRSIIIKLFEQLVKPLFHMIGKYRKRTEATHFAHLLETGNIKIIATLARKTKADHLRVESQIEKAKGPAPSK